MRGAPVGLASPRVSARIGLVFCAAFAAIPASGSGAASASPVTNVTVKGTRVHLGDVVGGLAEEVATVDLGPTPSSSGSRIITREEITRALHERGVDGAKALPEAVRIHRQLRVLRAAELTRLVTDGLEDKLPRGTSLREVRPLASVNVPDGFTEVRCDLPRPPHRVGALASAATLSFFEDGQALWTISVPVDLLLSQEATVYDVPRGSHVTFVIRRGLVEVSSTGTVTVDADVGTVAPVTVMPSGRSLPARLEDATTAVMVETP